MDGGLENRAETKKLCVLACFLKLPIVHPHPCPAPLPPLSSSPKPRPPTSPALVQEGGIGLAALWLLAHEFTPPSFPHPPHLPCPVDLRPLPLLRLDPHQGGPVHGWPNHDCPVRRPGGGRQPGRRDAVAARVCARGRGGGAPAGHHQAPPRHWWGDAGCHATRGGPYRRRRVRRAGRGGACPPPSDRVDPHRPPRPHLPRLHPPPQAAPVSVVPPSQENRPHGHPGGAVPGPRHLHLPHVRRHRRPARPVLRVPGCTCGSNHRPGGGQWVGKVHLAAAAAARV